MRRFWLFPCNAIRGVDSTVGRLHVHTCDLGTGGRKAMAETFLIVILRQRIVVALYGRR